MNAVVVIGKNYTYKIEDFLHKYVIGVDAGALFCIKNSIRMDLAIGDFDSVTSKEKEEIVSKTKTICLNPIKDDTDTKCAIDSCKQMEKITILGGISGNRIEHFYANLSLLIQDERIEMKDDDSYIFTINKDFILKKSEYTYFSLFSIEPKSILSIQGAKYPLNNYVLRKEDSIGISNEWIKDEVQIQVSGRILVILSKKDMK